MKIDITKLSLEEKIAQMIITGVSTPGINPTIQSLISKNKIGGVMLFYRNLSDMKNGLELISKLKKENSNNGIPLFIATDQEWGRVNRLDRSIVSLPSAKKMWSKKDPKVVSNVAKVTGEILNELGINMNLAPVLDIGGFDDKHSLGDRCASTKPSEVTEFMKAYTTGVDGTNVIPVTKHFPGNGASKLDSHMLFMPTSYKPLKELEKKELVPFKAAIERKVPVFMVGHINLSCCNSFTPASLSKQVVTGLLREKYGYNGIVITDDLCMASVRLRYGIRMAAIKAFLAGNDILIIKNEKSIEKVIQAIKLMVSTNIITEKRINESVKRIIVLKEKFNITNGLPEGINVKEINEKLEKLRGQILEA